jgi:hypothetical protein
MLLDSDRFWPAVWGHQSSGALQIVGFPRAPSVSLFARGNVIVPIQFTAIRIFDTIALAYDYAFKKVPAANGQKGTLLIQIPGGGSLSSVGCGCEASPCDLNGVKVETQWRFIGPRLT